MDRGDSQTVTCSTNVVSESSYVQSLDVIVVSDPHVLGEVGQEFKSTCGSCELMSQQSVCADEIAQSAELQ